MLPTSKRSNFDEATQALSERLYPIESEALVSAQLMRRKQQSHESVDEFAQDLDKFFERSYGRRRGMDEASKALLKRDVFVQGLLLRWQKKVLPSASTYSDALHQARAVEQQERQLLKLHPTMKPFSKSKPMTEPKIADPVPADPKVKQPKATHPRQRGGPPKCYECGSTSHKWRECSLRKPTETPGKVPTASSLAITTHSESIDERCQRLQQEWVDAEFARMTSAYETTASVDQIAGAVGPLCYATVEIAGESVKAMVDTGSSATVLSFELFSKIGKNAKIPATALSKPDVVLRDYNRRPIPVGAKVDLTFRYCGKSVVAPVYVRAGGHDESETCLLGTNVIFALGLMEPAVGVCRKVDSCATTSTVCLTRSTKIPAKVGAYLDVHLGKHFAVDTELAFEPDRTQSGSVGLELEDSILCVGPDNNLKIPVLNKADVSMDLLGGVPIGTVTVLTDFEEMEDTLAQENSSTQSPKISMVSPGNLTTPRQQRLESALTISPTLTSKQSAELMKCVVNHHDVFALDDGEVGEVIGVEHKIHTGDSAPIRQLPRRVPFAVRGEITRMVQEMLKDGVIQESASPWASPIVLVKKKDGTLRFCVDYRRLNAVTHKDTFPLPRIDDLLDQMQGKKVFSTLDAKRGYWQIKVQEESKEKTAFVTFEGLYEFRVMPFGLCNAPSTFQRLMQRILQGLGSFCSVYIDDILVFSESVEEHLVHLSQIF